MSDFRGETEILCSSRIHRFDLEQFRSCLNRRDLRKDSPGNFRRAIIARGGKLALGFDRKAPCAWRAGDDVIALLLLVVILLMGPAAWERV
jgi:hypothetical protein